MKLGLSAIPWIGFIVALIFMCVYFNAYRNEKDARVIAENNYKAEKEGHQKTVRAKNQTIEQVLEENDGLREELKSEKIKEKDVVTVERLRYRDTGSTTIIYRDTTLSNGQVISHGSVVEKCFKADIWIVNDSVAVFNREVFTDILLIGDLKRKNLWGKKWLPRWGKHELFSTAIDKCNNDTLIQHQKTDILR